MWRRYAWSVLIILAGLLAACPAPGGSSPPLGPSPQGPPSSSKDITSFSIVSPLVTGVVTGTAIAAWVPNGTNLTGLVAAFTTTGVSVKVGATLQASRATANDFRSPVTYIVTAEDGTTKSYTVAVGPLVARRYLAAHSIATSNLDVVNGDPHLMASSGLTNQFPDNSPVVFLNGTAPAGIVFGQVYYTTGFGTASIKIYSLVDSTHTMFTSNSQVNTGATIYQVDWLVIHVGKVSLPGNMINMPGHGLKVGDAVYIACNDATNKMLKSGAYHVTTVPDADNFGTDADIWAQDSFNYLAKIGSNGGTPF